MLSNSIVLFGLIIASNLLALGLLPKTEGFTQVNITIACVSFVIINFWALSRVIYNGMDLSLLVPIMSAVLPLGTIIIGVVLYGESASIMKIITLIIACGLIGVASKLS